MPAFHRFLAAVGGAAALAACRGPGIEPPTTTPFSTCAERVVSGPVELDPDGPDTQIHAGSTPDATGVWVAYNRPDDAGMFDVFLVHLDCEGIVDVGPVQVDDSDDNEIDPSVAIRDGRVVVAWQADDGAATANLSVRWRVLGTDGQPLGAVQRLDHGDSAWMPALAAGPDGFHLAGSWADGVWTAFRQDLADDGAPDGPAAAIGGDPGTGQLWPSVGAGPVFAFEQDEAAWWSAGQAPTAFSGPGFAPTVAPDGSWIAWSDGADGLFLAEPGGPAVALSAGPGPHFGATVVAHDGEAVVAWYTNEGGLQNRIRAARFGAGGDREATVELGDRDAPPYGMNLVEVEPGLFFLAWQGGANPDYRVVGEFFAL